MSANVVEEDVLRFVVRSLDGDLELPAGASSPGRVFFIEAVEEIQQHLEGMSPAEFSADARGHAAVFGVGSPLDLMRPAEMLRVAAEIDATEFAGRVEFFEGDDFSVAVRRVLMAVYGDVYSAVGAALESGELKWNGHRLAVGK